MPGNPDPSHTVPASMPAYAVRAFSWTAVVVVAASVCLVLGWHEEQAWARMSAVTLVMVAAVTLGVTVLCLRQDAMRRDIVAAQVRLDENTIDLTNTTAALSSEVEGLKALMGDFTKRYPPVEVEKRLAELAEQQETLAGMIADSPTLTLDVPNGDVYELGKRVGRDEAMREWGKDQTP